MDDLQAAVLACLDPHAEASLKQRALKYCHDIQNSTQGFIFVLQTLSPAMKPEVAFWCLTVLHHVISDPNRYAQLSQQERNALRSTTLAYLAHAIFSENVSIPSFLLNKLAQVVVAIIAADYPHAWPSAFHECILPLVGRSRNGAIASAFIQQQQHPEKLANDSSNAQLKVTFASVGMFLRFLRAVDDDVTSVRAAQVSNAHRATSVRVKDAMRDDCVSDIMQVCAELLVSSEHVKLSSQAFDIVARYVEWVDVGLIVQSRFVKPMYEAITSTGACAWRAAAAAALRAIIQKRMSMSAKVKLLRLLDVDALMGAIRADVIAATANDEDGSVESEVNFQSGHFEVAVLVNGIAMVALDCVKTVCVPSGKGNGSGSTSANGNANTEDGNVAVVDGELLTYLGNVARHALPVALQMLDENTDEGTNGTQTLDCVASYVNVYGQLVHAGRIATNHENVTAIGEILRVIEERGKFSDDVDPKDEDSERVRAFKELRNAFVSRVFPSITRMFTELCVQFVKQMYTKASNDIGGTELALALVASLISVAADDVNVQEICVFVLGSPPECLRHSAVAARMNGFREQQAQQQQLEHFQNAQVHLLELVSSSYFEVIGRSARVLVNDSDGHVLSTVLKVIFDERGLGHLGSEEVRSKAAGALVKICKPLRGMMSYGHVEAIVRAAHEHMFPVEEDVSSQRWKNQMLMFETVGYLLGTAQNKDGANGRDANAAGSSGGVGNNVVGLVFAMLKTIVDGVTSREGMSCVAYIGAAGYLSKGFGGDLKYLAAVGAGKENKNVTDAVGADNNNTNINNKNKVVVMKKNEKKGGMMEEMKRVWMNCVAGVLKGSEGCLSDGAEEWKVEMRLKLIFFLHRMVETVGSELMWYLGVTVPELVRYGVSAVELKEVLSLMSQSTIRFREKFEVVSKIVDEQIVERVMGLSFEIDERSGMAVSEWDREVVEVGRGFMYWVNVMVSCGLMDSWWGKVEMNGVVKKQAMLTVVMGWVVRNAVGEGMDVRVGASVGKMAWQTIGWMVERWGNNSSAGWMNDFVMQQVSQACVRCVWNGRHSGGSGEATHVVTELVRVQSRCMRRYGGLFADALYSIVGGQVGQEDWNLYLTDLTRVPLTWTFAESVQRWAAMVAAVNKK